MSISTRNALRSGLLYLLLSVLWIQLSQRLLSSFFDDPEQLVQWQIVRGYLWVSVSAVLIFLIHARYQRFGQAGPDLKPWSEDRERLRQAAAVFDCTREG
ncbi:MAG: GGDEF domain-containing protein, partial [Pseudomonas sp.]